MTWIQTRGGLPFDYEDPKPEQIDIRDIAHALGFLCRFAGHSSRFYSVAEHSVHVATLLLDIPFLARWGLLHDAHEAYVVDVPSPLKRLLPDYKRLEAIAETAVRFKFGLVGGMPDAVKATDRVLFQHEAAALQGPSPRPGRCPPIVEVPAHTGTPGLGWDPPCWSPHEASSRFLDLFLRLFHEGQPEATR